MVVTPVNNNKKIRAIEHITSSGNTPITIPSSTNIVSNKPVLSSIGVNLPTSANELQPQGNTKKDRIQQTQSRAKKNKLEDYLRNVRPSLHKKKSVVNTKAISSVPNSKLNVNSNLICATCNRCLYSDNHDSYVLEFINSVNARVKSKYAKKPVNTKIWIPTGKVFTTIGHKWRPTGRIFTLVGNVCPLTRITTTAIVVQIVLWYLDSGCSKHMTEDRSQLINFVQKFLGTVKFRNDHVAKIMGYGDYKIGNVTILRVYFMEGLGRYDGVLTYLSFVQGLKDQVLALASPFITSELCKKKSHKPKSKDINQEKLYLLHMDLCGPMRVESKNGKKYILVIVDDYSCFTWVKCLRSKDETPDFIIKFLKMIKVRLNVPVHCIRIDNGTEFVNQTLREYYEQVGISHKTSVARSPQQNGFVERRNRTLIEDARTMLIYAQALLFLWVEAVATACYTQNRSIVRLCHGKTPYELLHNKLPDLSFLYVFGALCYPTNDSENLGKLQPKADTGIIIGYAPTKKAFWIYNRHTRRIIETIHVDFDELTAMDSEQKSSGPALNEMTPATIKTQSPVILQDVEKDIHNIEVAHMENDLLFGMPIPEEASDQSSSTVSPHTIEQPDHQIPQHNSKWTKDHPLDNIIGQLSRPVSTRLQLYEQALFCYYDAFLTSVEPKTYKDALTQSCWIEAMQKELNEFERLEV
nr:retrovirus-related Pol polyprotein from transposon TNT 1-94 [Tanacetum cinerariifolium]